MNRIGANEQMSRCFERQQNERLHRPKRPKMLANLSIYEHSRVSFSRQSMCQRKKAKIRDFREKVRDENELQNLSFALELRVIIQQGNETLSY